MLPETKSFKKLKATWYKKLEKSGFVDAENEKGELNTYSSKLFKRRGVNDDAHTNPAAYQARQQYYTYARQFLHECVFKNEKEKKIWELHSEGVSFRKIGANLNVNKDYVNDIVKKYAKEMLKLNGISL